jgi:phosphonate transport system substrate-binding protein
MRSSKLFAAACLLLFIASACNLPITPLPATPTSTAAVQETLTPTPVATVGPALGEEGNPILLALPPSRFMNPVTVSNGQTLATLLEEQTGLRIVAVAPNSYAELIEALKVGNAHIAVLPMFAIVQAYQKNAVTAAFATTQDDVAAIGAQIIARGDRFTAQFSPPMNENTVDAPHALAQFAGKKPCWTEPDSPSGYMVAAGILNWYQIPIQEGAFLQSHYAVVRAVRLGEVCDFGSTYIDARTYPALKGEYPSIMNEVVVIWQIPPIIPYDGLFLSSSLPLDIQIKLKRALDLVFATDDGKTLFDTLFGIKSMIAAEDIFYAEFVRYIGASGADLNSLIH